MQLLLLSWPTVSGLAALIAVYGGLPLPICSSTLVLDTRLVLGARLEVVGVCVSGRGGALCHLAELLLLLTLGRIDVIPLIEFIKVLLLFKCHLL